MNWFWVIAGGMAMIGGLAHMILGELWILSRVDIADFEKSPAGDKDTLKRYIRWFWHTATAVFLITSVAAVLIGVTDFMPHEKFLARFLAFQGATFLIAYLVVALPRPWMFVRMPQGMAIAVVCVLLWFGAKLLRCLSWSLGIGSRRAERDSSSFNIGRDHQHSQWSLGPARNVT